VTKTEPLLYTDLHSHLLTHEFLHKISLSPMRYAIINTPLLLMPNTPLKPSFLTVSLLEILAATEAVSMEDGVPISSIIEGIGLLCPELISANSLAPSMVIAIGKAIDRAIGSATGDRIHTTNYAKHSVIQPLTTLSSNIGAMKSSLVQIWRCVICPQPVLSIGFWTPLQINTLHLTLQVWLPQNHTSVMIICMLVMVRDSPYVILVI